MFLIPCTEIFTMWTIPCEVSCVPTHEALMFLLLVVIHGLCHPQGQSFYVIWLGSWTLHQIRVCWEQIHFYSSCTSHWGGILLVTLMRVMELKLLLWSHFVVDGMPPISWPDGRECQSWCPLVLSPEGWP